MIYTLVFILSLRCISLNPLLLLAGILLLLFFYYFILFIFNVCYNREYCFKKYFKNNVIDFKVAGRFRMGSEDYQVAKKEKER